MIKGFAIAVLTKVIGVWNNLQKADLFKCNSNYVSKRKGRSLSIMSFFKHTGYLPENKVLQHDSEEEYHLKPTCTRTPKREQLLQYYIV